MSYRCEYMINFLKIHLNKRTSNLSIILYTKHDNILFFFYMIFTRLYTCMFNINTLRIEKIKLTIEQKEREYLTQQVNETFKNMYIINDDNL